MDRISASAKERYGRKNKNKNENKDKNENKNEDKNENDEEKKDEKKKGNNIYVSVRVYDLGNDRSNNAKWKFTETGDKLTYTLNGDTMSTSFDTEYPKWIVKWIDDEARDKEWNLFWKRLGEGQHVKLYLNFTHSQKPRDYALSERKNKKEWNYTRSSMFVLL